MFRHARIAILLLLALLVLAGTASAATHIGKGRYVGVINGVRVDAAMTILGDSDTGYTSADVLGVTPEEYRVLGPYLASGFCRFVAREEGGAINLATLTGGDVQTNTLTSFRKGTTPVGPDPDGDDIKHGIWIRNVTDGEAEINRYDLSGGNPVGNVPALPPGVHVTHADWTERWVQVSPGAIVAIIDERISYAGDQEIRSQWTTTVTYETTTRMLPFEQVRTTKDAITVYDEAKQAMHVSMTSSVAPAEVHTLPRAALDVLVGLGVLGMVGAVRFHRRG